jgi:asparagine synthase (glutamine-hydrolysing)
MCGICGGWLPGGVSPEAVGRALDNMRHRGPDDSGRHFDGPAALGMVRLSIIDLDGGHQPVFNEDRSVAVVFNGEIYNYRELMAELKQKGHRFRSASDTEVLVHLYEEVGANMCERLRGMFALAIWDTRQRRLFLARDRFGKKPLYYARTAEGGIVFASELKGLRPLMHAAALPAEIRSQGIYDYLSLGFVPQPETIYRDVHALPMGSWLTYDGDRFDLKEYWRLDFSRKQKLTYREALERTRALVSESVRLRLRSDVPLGIFLSGGVDSSVIAYEAARELGGSLQSFTVAMGAAAFDESPVAARTARKLGIQHHVLPLRVSPLEEIERLVRHYDQPYADSSAIPSMAISRLARQHVTVILNGDGGDEVFAGYRRNLAARLASLGQWFPRGLSRRASQVLLRLSGGARRSLPGFAGRFLRGANEPWATRYLIWTGDLLLEADKRRVWQGEPLRPTEELIETIAPPNLSNLDRQLFSDIHLILQSGLLVKMDMATMAASVEGRSPLLDYRIIEFTASLSDGHRIHRGRLKSLLRDAYADLLPDEVIRGRKRGFEVPLRQWLENDLREQVHDTLSASSARLRDYVAGSFLKSLLRGPQGRNDNWEGVVYTLMVLELWLRAQADVSLDDSCPPGVTVVPLETGPCLS